MRARTLVALVVLVVALAIVLFQHDDDPERARVEGGEDAAGSTDQEVGVVLAQQEREADRVPSSVAQEPTPADEQSAPAPARRWSDLLAPVDAITGVAIAQPVVVHVGLDGRRRELAFDALVGEEDLAAGSLLALDGPAHVIRAFWPRALDLGAEAPQRVALDPSATLRFEMVGGGYHGPEAIVCKVELDLDGGFVLERGRALGFSSGRAEFEVIELGEAIWNALRPQLDRGRIGELRRRHLERLAGLEPSELLSNLALPPLLFGQRARIEGHDELELTELAADAPYRVAVPWMRERHVRIARRGTDVWFEDESMPVRLGAGELAIVDVDLSSLSIVRGRVPVPVSTGYATLWGTGPRNPLDPSEGTVDTAEDRFEFESGGTFEFTGVQPGTKWVDVRWEDELGVQARAVRHFELAPGETKDLGLLDAEPGVTLSFRTHVIVDGVPAAIQLTDAFYEVMLFPAEPGNDGRASEEAQRRDVESFGLRGIAPGAYTLLLGRLQLFGEDANHYRVLSTTMDVERELMLDTDRTINVHFELERITTTRFEAAVPSFDPETILASYSVNAIAWNRATGELVEPSDSTRSFFLRYQQGDVHASLALSSGTWTVAMTFVPRMVDVDTPPVAGAIPSWAAVTDVVIDPAAAVETVRVVLEPATVIVAPVRRHPAPIGWSAAVVPSDWPDAAAKVWSVFGENLGDPVRIHGCLPNTSYREPSAAIGVLTGAVGEAVEILE